MSRTRAYRQQVADFRTRLNNIISGAGPSSGRTFIDSTGSRTTSVPSANAEQRLVLYGQRRHHTAARVLALFEMAREAEQLYNRAHPVRVEHTGAVWQAFPGTTTDNACHTVPSHLQLDGQLPTRITTNRGLQRHIIVEFADCMLLPRAINNIDSVVDELAGRQAFADAAEMVLNERGTDWRQGLGEFKRQMRDLLGGVADAMIQLRGREYRASDATQQDMLDTLGAYYEGLFLHSENAIQIDNFRVQVNTEVGIP